MTNIQKQTDEIVECDRCHDDVPSHETFTNADDETLCNECSYGLVGDLAYERYNR